MSERAGNPAVADRGDGRIRGNLSVDASAEVIERTPPMIKLTCLIRRKDGMSPEDFHAYWRDHHGPLVASTKSGSHVVRYEQHHRPMDDYGETDDGGYDGVTVQLFGSMDEYKAHTMEKDFADVWADLPKFLDVDRLAFVLTEEPIVIMDGPTG